VMPRASITTSRTIATPISTSSWPDQAIIKANSSPAVTVCQAGPEARSRQMMSPAVITAATSMPLPLLIGVFGFLALQAVIMNKAMNLIVVLRRSRSRWAGRIAP
jgi:hypothetical protein